jgi:hypothetical protein
MTQPLQHVFLISERKEDLDLLKLLAEKRNLKLSIFPKTPDSLEVVDPTLIFVDASTEAQFLEYEKLTSQYECIQSHFISDLAIHLQRYLPKSKSFCGFIQRGANSMEDLVHQYTIAMATPNIQDLNTKPFSFKTIEFTHTHQKYEAIDIVAEDLRHSNVSERIIGVVSNAVDEIIMNGMFDSKMDENGNQVYRNTPRSDGFDLTSQVSLKYSISQDYIILSVKDNFGTLNREKFYDYVSKIKSKKDFADSSVSAGIGLAQIYLSGGSLFFHCNPGKKTEVFVLFKKATSFSEFKSQSKFIVTSFSTEAA